MYTPISYTPGTVFRGLNADKTLHALYDCDKSVHYETVADSFNFFSNACTFGLESPLGEVGPDGGYFICLNRQQWGELLTGSPNIVPDNFAVHPVWQQIIAF
ncbi:MAG: hypothetical protein PHR66_13130, partial [Desulfuromonadaceae bacterium]|nr:hypothetical protein [Desulfuromonadaceae bacterium]